MGASATQVFLSRSSISSSLVVSVLTLTFLLCHVGIILRILLSLDGVKGLSHTQKAAVEEQGSALACSHASHSTTCHSFFL